MTTAKIYHCKPWTPKVKEVAEVLIEAIHNAVPELQVQFIGAAALGLPGKNDIDLDVLCDVNDVPKYTAMLKSALGEPQDTDTEMSVWSFDKDGFEVDAILSDPRISHVPLQRARFEKLKSNPELLEEYRRFKIDCDGLPYEEYEKRKDAFLESRVVPKV